MKLCLLVIQILNYKAVGPHDMEPLRTEVGGWRNCSRKTFPISSQSIYYSPHKQTCSLLQAVHWRMTKWIYFLEVFHLLNKQGCIKRDLSLRWIEDFFVRVWKLLFIEEVLLLVNIRDSIKGCRTMNGII